MFRNSLNVYRLLIIQVTTTHIALPLPEVCRRQANGAPPCRDLSTLQSQDFTEDLEQAHLSGVLPLSRLKNLQLEYSHIPMVAVCFLEGATAPHMHTTSTHTFVLTHVLFLPAELLHHLISKVPLCPAKVTAPCQVHTQHQDPWQK